MKKSIFAVLLILSFAFVACNGGGGSGPSTYIISGTVTLNDVGYEGVTITLSGDTANATSTDNTGFYFFKGVEDGDYIVTASLSANGYTQTFAPFSLFPTISEASSTGNDFTLETHDIRGQVVMDGSGYPGVTVVLGGDAADTVVSDALGNYVFAVLNGDYTVTASLSGQTLDPPTGYSPSINGVESVDNNFVLDTYTISGQVTRLGLGYEGAVVSLSGDSTDTYTTLGDGNYSFTVLNGDYTVTSSVTGQTLTSNFINPITVASADSADNDFALDHHVISGKVTLSGSGFEAVRLSLTGTSYSGEIYNNVEQFTDNEGAYSFTVLNGSNYTLIPSLSGQTLTPSSRITSVNNIDSLGNDFLLDNYQISGQVIAGGVGYSNGATVNLGGDRIATTVADSSGNYSFTGLLNGSYNVTPEISGQTVAPPVRNITIANSSSSDNNFTLDDYVITGRVTLNGVGYEGVTVTLSGTSGDSTTTGASGNYTFVVINGTYTVTPSLIDQMLNPANISGITISDNNSTDNDFELITNTLSGQVTLNGSGHPGVSVSLSGTTMANSTTTDGLGNYTFEVLKDTYTVTPSLTGQTLSPSNIPAIFVSGIASPGHDFSLITYPISGQVTLLGSPYEDATLNLTGDLTDSTTTDSGGDYIFNVLNGTYTVTPEVTGQLLTPLNISGIVISSGADTGNNFAINTHTLSGTVRLSGGPYEGASVALSGAAIATTTTTTDTSGNYSFADLINGDYTVTPTVSGQTLTPTSLTPTITNADSTGNDFDINTYTISGQVTLSGSPYPSAQISLTGDSSDSTSTNSSGDYSFTGLLSGDYTVTPIVTGQTLSPSFTDITITTADSTGNDFALDTYTISGKVTLGGVGYAGADVNLSGDATDGTITPSSGDYSFTGLLSGDYTVTPIVSGQTLSPSFTDITITTADSTGNDFALDTYTISGQVTNNSGPLSGIRVNLSGTATRSTATVAGNYSFAELLNGSYTVTPISIPQTFAPVSSAFSISSGSEAGVNFAIPTMIWVVDGSAASTTEDGFSWQTALTHPQDASDNALSGDQVWVVEGTYISSDADSTVPVLYLQPGVEYYGGFEGTETSISGRDIFAHPTILDGEGVTDEIVFAADDTLLSGFVAANASPPMDTTKAPVNALNVSNFRIHDCIVEGNTAALSGTVGSSGLIIMSGEVKNCIFRNNSGRLGPLVVAQDRPGDVDILNSLFYNNTYSYGGGIIASGFGDIRVINITIADNFVRAGYVPNGILIDQFGFTTTSITNSIVQDGIFGFSGYGIPTVSYSNIEAGGSTYATGTNIDLDPQFVDSGSNDYRLSGSSPSINTGSNAAAIAVSLTTDLDGNDRILDGDVDMGAYEYVAP